MYGIFQNPVIGAVARRGGVLIGHCFLLHGVGKESLVKGGAPGLGAEARESVFEN